MNAFAAFLASMLNSVAAPDAISPSANTPSPTLEFAYEADASVDAIEVDDEALITQDSRQAPVASPFIVWPSSYSETPVPHLPGASGERPAGCAEQADLSAVNISPDFIECTSKGSISFYLPELIGPTDRGVNEPAEHQGHISASISEVEANHQEGQATATERRLDHSPPAKGVNVADQCNGENPPPAKGSVLEFAQTSPDVARIFTKARKDAQRLQSPNESSSLENAKRDSSALRNGTEAIPAVPQVPTADMEAASIHKPGEMRVLGTRTKSSGVERATAQPESASDDRTTTVLVQHPASYATLGEQRAAAMSEAPIQVKASQHSSFVQGRADTKAVQIALKTELGEVRIRADLTTVDSVSATVQTDHKQVSSILVDQAPALERALADRHIVLETFSVNDGGGGSQGSAPRDSTPRSSRSPTMNDREGQKDSNGAVGDAAHSHGGKVSIRV